MDSYDLYKPLRNHLRRISLLSGLGTIRTYLQNFQFSEPFPSDIGVHSRVRLAPDAAARGVFEWELEILAKELILNSPATGQSELTTWNEFSGAINELKDRVS